MWRDEIVEEVRKARDEYAAQFDYDLHAMARDLREKQEQSGKKIIRLKSKKAEETVEETAA
jgi:hypothetical protein